jgi:hypothetical protein
MVADYSVAAAVLYRHDSLSRFLGEGDREMHCVVVERERADVEAAGRMSTAGGYERRQLRREGPRHRRFDQFLQHRQIRLRKS